MSAPQRWAVAEQVVLQCDVRSCEAAWVSEVHHLGYYGDDARRWVTIPEAARPALDLGWRVFVGQRTQHTYCPAHGPKSPMRLAYGGAA